MNLGSGLIVLFLIVIVVIVLIGLISMCFKIAAVCYSCYYKQRKPKLPRCKEELERCIQNCSSKTFQPTERQKYIPAYQYEGINQCQNIQIDYECAICFETKDYTRNSVNRVKALLCMHSFHAVCINKWLAEKRECPVCRTYIPPIEDLV